MKALITGSKKMFPNKPYLGGAYKRLYFSGVEVDGPVTGGGFKQGGF